MKKFLVILSATMIISGLVTMSYAATTGPEKVTYTPKMGAITFDHLAHQKRAECSTCHHTEGYATCKSCHGVDPKAPKAKNAFHKTCKGCHKKIKKGPIKCKECHIK